MKIVAIISESQYGREFMLSATEEELSIIASGIRQRMRNTQVGTDIRVGEHWRRVLEINGAQGQLDSAASGLRAVAELLGTISVTVPPRLQPEEPTAS